MAIKLMCLEQYNICSIDHPTIGIDPSKAWGHRWRIGYDGDFYDNRSLRSNPETLDQLNFVIVVQS